MNQVSWYRDRLKTMSLPEIIYRSNQQVQKQLEKRGYRKISHDRQDYEAVLAQSRTSDMDALPTYMTAEFKDYHLFQFFIYSLDIKKPVDWHKDISSGKSFPLSFAKDIDIRSGRFGSAKVVWEINRLQFLLPLAIKYTVTKKTADLERWMGLVKDWVQSNPYMQGINWYSNIEVNIRLIVWYYCWQVLWQEESLKNNKAFNSFVKDCWLPSIYEHCVYSYSNPSKYSSANNHLISEYAGLFTAACCWPFAEAEKWKAYAKRGLEKEMVLQHSKDGVNKEQAAEYIQFITDFFLIPYAVGQRSGNAFSESYKSSLISIFSYINSLLDVREGYRKYGDEDDGKVLVVSTDPHFNNFSSLLSAAAIVSGKPEFKKEGRQTDLKNLLLFGEAGRAAFEKMEAGPVQSRSAFYKEEGQFIFRKAGPQTQDEIYLHMDAAPLGFLSIAAHGHADALSVALHVNGYPFIADAGTFTYHTDKEWRAYFISTMAHNTVCIDGENQARQAGPTMWLQHFQIENTEVTQGEKEEAVSAGHSGYKNIGCEHKRTVLFSRDHNIFTIRDEIQTDGRPHNITLPWHLHPDVRAEQNNNNPGFSLQHAATDRKVTIECDPSMSWQVVNGQTQPKLGWYSASFLSKEPTSVILGQLTTSSKKQYSLITIIKIH